MAKVVFLLFFLFSYYNSISSLVTDYQIVTWNSQGYKLQQVFDLFLRNPSLNLVLVQESGNVAKNIPGNLVTTNLPEFTLTDGENAFSCGREGNFELRSIQHQNVPLYIYYFPTITSVNTQISQTIVSRHLATEILYFKSDHIHQKNPICNDHTFTNRPIPGLVINNDNIFLNIHAENVVNHAKPRNEVPIQLKAIRTYMKNYRPNASWILAGDFNRIPSSLSSDLTRQEQLVEPPAPTHDSRVLDYLIYGSSSSSVFAQMNTTQYRGTLDNSLQSDHKAVYYKR